MKHTQYRAAIISIAFIGVIGMMFLNNVFEFLPDSKNTENRAMATKPNLDFKHLDQYPAQYEAYYNDTFALRSRLSKLYNYVQLRIFHQSPIPEQVIIGNNEWFFSSGAEMESYQGINRFTSAELSDLKQEFEYRKQYLAARNCKFYVVVAPIKATIYPEFMPSNYFRGNDTTWGEQLVNYLQKNSSVNVINLYTAIRNLKHKNLLYYRNDNHWNPLCAMYVTNAILNRLHTDFPNVTPLNESDFKVTTTTQEYGNLTNMLSDDTKFIDTVLHASPLKELKSKPVDKVGYPTIEDFPANEFETNRETADTTLPRLLFITDSFGNEVFPFISEKFSRTVHIFDAWQYKLNENIVEAEKPSVVILLMLEVHVRNIFKYRSLQKK